MSAASRRGQTRRDNVAADCPASASTVAGSPGAVTWTCAHAHDWSRSGSSVPAAAGIVRTGPGRPESVATLAASAGTTTSTSQGRSRSSAAAAGENSHGSAGSSNSTQGSRVDSKSVVPSGGSVRITWRASIPVTSPGPYRVAVTVAVAAPPLTAALTGTVARAGPQPPVTRLAAPARTQGR